MRTLLAATLLSVVTATSAQAKIGECDALPSHEQLKTTLTEAVKPKNGGLGLPMWASIVDRSGVVCAVAYSGVDVDDQWPGSRVISAQKANTANAFSLEGLSLSTANLYSPTQPGGSLFGLQESNPVNAVAAYRGGASAFGTDRDPMVGERIGGVNVFGGGLALYDDHGSILGALGVSGDTSCADHNIAWRVRNSLKLDYVPNGVAPNKSDNIIYDIKNGKSAGGYGHPTCGGTEDAIAKDLTPVSSVKKQ